MSWHRSSTFSESSILTPAPMSLNNRDFSGGENPDRENDLRVKDHSIIQDPDEQAYSIPGGQRNENRNDKSRKYLSFSKSMKRLRKRLGKGARSERHQKKTVSKEESIAKAGENAATRTTVSSHFELPSSQQKELWQLSTENHKLQEQLHKTNAEHNKLRNELMNQKLEFQQQKHDLEHQIQVLKLNLEDLEPKRKTCDVPTSRHSPPPMRVDYAGDVVPFNLGKIGAINEDSEDLFPPFAGRQISASSYDSDDSGILDGVEAQPTRFVSEDPRNFDLTQQRRPVPEALKRHHSEAINPRGRRAGIKLRANRGMTAINRDSATLDAMGAMDIFKEGNQLLDFVKQERLSEWLKSFRRSDPRFQILSFFDEIAQDGADHIDQGFDPTVTSPLLRMFDKASVFTVWRPTSLDAIRRMMLGEGVGKGLDIKGKSAKKGKLSGYVPFLQIYQEEHKKQVRTHPKHGRIRVFFNSKKARDQVVSNLEELAEEMVNTVVKSKKIVAEDTADDDTMEWAMQKLIWEMTDTKIRLLDDYAPSKFGMHVPERLFWEGMVVRQNISREPGSENDTGRPSEPNFQNMNCLSLRKEPEAAGPKCVIMQYTSPDEDVDNLDPMNPLNLVMAYEENARVMPVVSDFDCFIVGTRGVRYTEPMAEDQLEVLKWCVNQIENVLDSGIQTKSWTSRWLEILKAEASKGFHPEIPPLGFSDPKSNDLMKHAIKRLKKEGAVRHGSECFNYYFPQELDDEFLVIANDFPASLRWKYVDKKGLQEVLSRQIDRGYTFPINPKWILCDNGWKQIYDKLLASQRPNVQDSLKMWYPPKSGIREKIEDIYSRHPEGFQRLDDLDANNHDHDGTAAMDLAEQELRAYLTFQRAKRKLRGIFVWRILLLEMRKKQHRKQRLSGTSLDENMGPGALLRRSSLDLEPLSDHTL